MFNLSAGDGVLTPEAKYWIGKVYQAEGDYLLAEQRYEEALEDARFLYVPGTRWDIYYSLSEIYLNRREFDRYEQTLLSVFDNEMQRNSDIIRREHSYVQVLKTDGLDKLLLLYRLKLSYSLEAASRLGRLYNSSELWKSSLIKNLYVMLTVFSAGIEELITIYPDFSFPVTMDEVWESDPEFLMDTYEDYCLRAGEEFHFSRDLRTFEALDLEGDRQRAESIIKKRFDSFSITPSTYTLLKIESGDRGFLEMDSLYSSLFFLGEALYREGSSDSALQMWSLLGMSSIDTNWKKLAFGKISDPEMETPFLKY